MVWFTDVSWDHWPQAVQLFTSIHFAQKSEKKKKKSTVSSMQPTHSVSKFRIKKEKNSYFLSALQPSQERYNLICHLYFARKNQGALEPKAAFDTWEGRENLTFPVWLRGRQHTLGKAEALEEQGCQNLLCFASRGHTWAKAQMFWRLPSIAGLCLLGLRLVSLHCWVERGGCFCLRSRAQLRKTQKIFKGSAGQQGAESRGGKCLVLVEILGWAWGRCISWGLRGHILWAWVED